MVDLVKEQKVSLANSTQSNIVPEVEPPKQESLLTEEQKFQVARCSLYQNMKGMDDEQEADDPMLRREKFAISLRKKKRAAIIGSKRKKTLETITRHRQNAFADQRPSYETEEISGVVPKGMRGQVGIMQAIDSLDSLVADPQMHPQLLAVLRGLRNVTASVDLKDQTEFNTLMYHPPTLPKLVAVLHPSVSKQERLSAQERSLRIEILCEAIWTLSNMTADSCNGIEERLQKDHNIIQILQAHLLENFQEHLQEQTPYETGHFTAPHEPLNDLELRLLRELLWFICNLYFHAEFAVQMTESKLVHQIFLIARSYHNQFDFGLWKVVLWVMRSIATTLPEEETIAGEWEPFFNFFAIFYDQQLHPLLVQSAGSLKSCHDQIHKDFIVAMDRAMSNFTEKQMAFFTKAPYRLAEFVALSLKDSSTETHVFSCLRILGALFVESDQLCSYIVSKKAQEFGLLPKLQLILATMRTKERSSVLWVLSNILINSAEERQTVIQSGIFANITMACRDRARSVKREAIHTIGNFITCMSAQQELLQIRNLVTNFEIEANLFEVLHEDWASPDNQQVALMTYQALFGLPKISPEYEQAEGIYFQKNFANRGGLELLERLQSDADQEIYELANQIMEQYFADYLDEMDTQDSMYIEGTSSSQNLTFDI